MTKRNIFIDIIKTLLIILVVLGHCIQYGSGEDYFKNGSFYENTLFIFIYSFHMPAFMIISGYLFGLSNKTDAIEVIKSKIKHLLIPIFTWSILYAIKTAIKNDTINLSIIKIYIDFCIYNLWFLWAVFYASLITIIVKQYFNNNITVHLFLIIVSFFVPDILNSHLYKFVYPFFLVGYYIRNIINIILKYKNIILITSTILFILLLLVYNYDSYIYTSRYYVTSYYQLYIDIYRFIIGFLGSCCIFMWIFYFKDGFIKIISPISYIGEKTLGIYIVSGIFNSILSIITKNLQSFNLIYVLLETFIIVILSLIVIKYIEYNAILKKYLLGYY